MKTLITGATGLLGRRILERMQEDGDVVGLGHRQAGSHMPSIDLRDAEAVRRVVETTEPDVVILSAAYRDPDFCEREPEETRRLNIAPVRTFCECLPARVRVVFISSDYVFSGEEPPYGEDSERRPINVYGQSKCDGEDLVLNRVGSLVLRIPLLVGVGSTWQDSGFVAKTTDLLRAGQSASLDHVGVRFPTYTNDVAEAIAFLVGRGHEGIYHLAGPRGGTKYQWALEIAEILDIDPSSFLHPLAVEAPTDAARPRDSRLVTDKLRQAGYNQFTDFRQAATGILQAFA